MKQKAFLDKELQQINFLDERFYHAGQEDGGAERYFPSVTHILNLYPKGAAFTQWLKDVGNNATVIADRAKEAGSKVHNGIEQILSNQRVGWGANGENYTLEEWQGLNRFKDFYDQANPQPLAGGDMHLVELNVFSYKYKYAGTCDLLCKIGDEVWLIDHKFGNAIYPTYYMQLMAYKVAIEEMNPDFKIDRVGVLHLKAKTRTSKRPTEKKPNDPWQGVGWQLVDPLNDTSVKEQAKLHKAEAYEVVWENFLRVLGIYYYETPFPKPKNLVYPAELSLVDDADIVEPSEEAEVETKSLLQMFDEDRERLLNLS